MFKEDKAGRRVGRGWAWDVTIAQVGIVQFKAAALTAPLGQCRSEAFVMEGTTSWNHLIYSPHAVTQIPW